MKLLLVFAALVVLTGCASAGGFNGLCAFMMVGQNEQGATFVRVQCKGSE